jgi:hypothetical protein
MASEALTVPLLAYFARGLRNSFLSSPPSSSLPTKGLIASDNISGAAAIDKDAAIQGAVVVRSQGKQVLHISEIPF